jgi:hypothetical protein
VPRQGVAVIGIMVPIHIGDLQVHPEYGCVLSHGFNFGLKSEVEVKYTRIASPRSWVLGTVQQLFELLI